jgi:hypothetical protein
LEDLGLQSALHKSLSGELQDIIEGVFLLSQKAKSLKTTNKRRGLENSLGVLCVEGQEGTSSLKKTSRE